MALSPDGKKLAIGGDGGRLELWDTTGVGNKATLVGHTGDITRVLFSPDGKTLASGGEDKKIRL